MITRIVQAIITLLVLGGVGVTAFRLSATAARRLWLWLFVAVVGCGVTMMDAQAFISRWGFNGDNPKHGLIALMDGTGSRPFVYRRLAPTIVRIGTDFAMPRLSPHAVDYLVNQSALNRHRIAWDGGESWGPRKAVAFHVAYVVVWLSLLGTLLAGALLVHLVRRCSAFEALMTASLGMCLVPLMFVGGAYLYDAPELLLWTSVLCVAIGGPVVLLPPMFLLMLVNKESALVAAPALFPILDARFGRRQGVVWTAVVFVLASAWVVFVRRYYAHQPGGAMEWWLPLNLAFWSNPKSYFLLAQIFSPALPAPRGANVILLLFFLLPIRFGWKTFRRDLKWALVLVTLALLPLFFGFCYMDELRNLSLCFPLLFLLIVEGVHGMFAGGQAAGVREG